MRGTERKIVAQAIKEAWDGPRNLLGSPQGTGTRLSEDRIVALVMAARRLPRGEVAA